MARFWYRVMERLNWTKLKIKRSNWMKVKLEDWIEFYAKLEIAICNLPHNNNNNNNNNNNDYDYQIQINGDMINYITERVR